MEINERASTSECPLSPPILSDSVSEEIKRLAEGASDKLSAYLQGCIQGSTDDFKLLEEINCATSNRYSDLESVAHVIASRLSQMQSKYDELKPLLEQIDEIDEVSRQLEETTGVLENYLFTLEQKLKKHYNS